MHLHPIVAIVLLASALAAVGCATPGSPSHPSPFRITGVVSVMKYSPAAMPPTVNVGYQVQTASGKWLVSRTSVSFNLAMNDRVSFTGVGPVTTPGGDPVVDGATLCAWVNAAHGAEGPWTLHELSPDEEYDGAVSPCP